MGEAHLVLKPTTITLSAPHHSVCRQHFPAEWKEAVKYHVMWSNCSISSIFHDGIVVGLKAMNNNEISYIGTRKYWGGNEKPFGIKQAPATHPFEFAG